MLSSCDRVFGNTGGRGLSRTVGLRLIYIIYCLLTQMAKVLDERYAKRCLVSRVSSRTLKVLLWL